MAKDAWFKCYPVQFLDGVADLRPNEIAVYTVVLMRMYDEGGPIPDNPERIAKRCNMRPTTCKKSIDTLCEEGKLHRKDGMLVNGKAEKVIESRRKVSEKSSQLAHQVWRKRREKHNENNEGPIQTHSKPNTEPMLIDNKNIEDREESPPQSPPRKRTGSRLAEGWQPDAEDRAYAAERGFSDPQIDDIAANFLDYWTVGAGRNKTHADWKRAWQSWIRKERPRAVPRDGPKHWNDHGTETGMSPTLERLILDEQCNEDRDCHAGTALLAADPGPDRWH